MKLIRFAMAIAFGPSHALTDEGPTRPLRKFRVRELKEKIMLWTVAVVLLILWLLGFSLSVGGSLIHALLVIALVVVVINLLQGRRAI